jgi:eukaryotic-like serine/threonine-protein kinase
VERVGRYRLAEQLGEGATGVVYRATDGERAVAVKLLRLADAAAERRFLREVEAARGADSRHLVPILDVGEGFLVMPLYRGGSLADRLRAHRRLSVAETVELAAQVGKGLGALHARSIVHRDVKPSNVLLDEQGAAALADFGLARGEGSTQVTRDGQLVGTPHYLAPELIEGRPAVPGSDVYALGCVLYECLAGSPPFDGRSAAAIGYAHLAERPPDPRDRRPDLSPEIVDAILLALEKDVRNRPTTATALARMLHLAHTASRARSQA